MGVIIFLDAQIILKWPAVSLFQGIKSLLCHIFAMKWGQPPVDKSVNFFLSIANHRNQELASLVSVCINEYFEIHVCCNP